MQDISFFLEIVIPSIKIYDILTIANFDQKFASFILEDTDFRLNISTDYISHNVLAVTGFKLI